MRFQALALVVVLAVVAAGCGGKKSATKTAGSASTTTTTSGANGSTGNGGGTSTTTASTTTTTAATTTTASGTPSFASTKNCVQLAGIGQKFAQAMAASRSAGRSTVTDIAGVYKALASAAPGEIRPDFETIAAAFGTYADAIKKAGYTPGKTPTAAQVAALTSLSKTFSSPKLRTAELHLSAWASKNCGGLTTTTG
jgi:hypothetical protein